MIVELKKGTLCGLIKYATHVEMVFFTQELKYAMMEILINKMGATQTAQVFAL